jgi:hypothetical protein
LGLIGIRRMLPVGVYLRIFHVQEEGNTELTQIALTLGGTSGRLRTRKGREREAGQEGNDRNHHQ